MIGCSCYKCGIQVPSEIDKHFTAKDGRILCDKCSQGVEPCSPEIKAKIIQLTENK